MQILLNAVKKTFNRVAVFRGVVKDSYTGARDNGSADRSFTRWKEQLKADFSKWLEGLNDIPSVSLPEEEPSIYTFYESLCLLGREVQLTNRKNSDNVTRFTEALTGFSDKLEHVSKTTDQLGAHYSKQHSQSTQELLTALVAIEERLNRLEEMTQFRPKRQLFHSTYDEWESVWEKQKKGLEIVSSHYRKLLRSHGVQRIVTVGEEFDPQRMIAISSECSEHFPLHTVMQELSPGYLVDGQLVKLAEVTVSQGKGE